MKKDPDFVSRVQCNQLAGGRRQKQSTIRLKLREVGNNRPPESKKYNLRHKRLDPSHKANDCTQCSAVLGLRRATRILRSVENLAFVMHLIANENTTNKEVSP